MTVPTPLPVNVDATDWSQDPDKGANEHRQWHDRLHLRATHHRALAPEWRESIGLPPYITQSFPMLMANTRVSPTARKAEGIRVPVVPGMVISSVTFGTGLSGSGYVTGENWIALYSNTSTPALLAQTADLTGAIGGSLSSTVASFTSPYTVPEDVWEIWVTFFINATTMPQFSCVSINAGVNLARHMARDQNNEYATPPATLQTQFVSQNASVIWVGLQ